MSIQPDLTQLTRRLDRLEDELRAARQQLQALEFSRQTQALEQAAFAPTEPNPAPGQKPHAAPGDPLGDALAAAKAELARAAAPATTGTGGIPVPPPVVAAPPSTSSTEPPPLPDVWEPVLPRAHARPEFFSEIQQPGGLPAGSQPEAAAPAGPAVLREWLEKLQLWPPSGGDNLEARLGAWWATRVGALLAVIGVVFFGIYLSRGTPPWVRFVELLAVSAGIAGLGLWLERKIEKFGAVVFAGGLALIHYTAFAGYAVPAVKVIDQVAVAAGWQLASAALLVGAAVWRRSAVIATLGTGLGLATAFFARGGGLDEFALCSAWLLGAAAVVFYRRWRWEAPSVLALPGAYAVYAALWLVNWRSGPAPAQGWAWLFLGATAALFFARDWRGARAGAKDVGAAEKWFQGANSTLAGLLGVGTALTLYRGSLAEFYFGAAALFALGAWLRRRQVAGDGIAAALTAKATGALALGVIERCDGRTIAIALLVQAWVTLWCARRLASRTLAWATGAVALVAASFFAKDAADGAAFFSAAGAGSLGFVLGLALLGAEAARRLVPETAREARQITEAAGAALAGTLGALAAANWQPAPWAAAFAAVLAGLLFAAGAARRAWGPALAGALVLLAGHALLWQAALRPAPGGAVLWWCALGVLAPTVALGALLGGRWLARQVSGGEGARGAAQLAVAGVVAWGLAVAGVAVVWFNQWTSVPALTACALLALGLGAAAPLLPERRLPWLATLAAAAGVALWLGGGAPEAPSEWLLVSALALWALPVGGAASPRHAGLLQHEPGAGLLRVVQLALAAAVTLKLCGALFAGTALVFVLALLALGAAALVWWPGLAAGLPLSWVFWIGAGLHALLHGGGRAPTLPTLAALLAWAPALALTRSPKISAFGTREAGWRRAGVGVQAVLAALGALVVVAAEYRGTARLEFLVAAVAATALVLRVGKVAAARPVAVALALAAGLLAAIFSQETAAHGWGEGLLAVLLVAGALVAAPLALAGGPRALSRRGRNGLAWALGAAGLALAFGALLAQPAGGALHRYVTVGWGVAAAAVFVTGLVARLRPHRLLGLAGLALCVPRAFTVDLSTPLERIAAFIALGGALLWVGFSYHKFRHLIVDAPEPANEAADNPKTEDKP